MSEAILVALQAVSFIIIVIIMAVMANTMAMTARERLAEYATLKALGFGPAFVVRLLFGESLLIALIGGGAGRAADAAAGGGLRAAPPARCSRCSASRRRRWRCSWPRPLVVGVVAAAWPAWRMSRIDIVAGLRHVA